MSREMRRVQCSGILSIEPAANRRELPHLVQLVVSVCQRIGFVSHISCFFGGGESYRLKGEPLSGAVCRAVPPG